LYVHAYNNRPEIFCQHLWPKKRLDVLDLDIREALDKLHGEIFAVVDKLPLANVIRERAHDFDAQVGKGIHDLHFDVCKRFDDADSARQADAIVIAVFIDL